MIAIPPTAKIYLATKVADFRKGINGLSRLCREELKRNPQSGAIFVFRNRRHNALKILYYDGSAFWLLIRRLSRGKIKWWPTSAHDTCELESQKLQVLIMGGNPQGAEFSEDWKKLVK